MAAEVGLPKENFLKQSEEKLKNGYVHKGMNLNDLYNEQSITGKIAKSILLHHQCPDVAFFF